MDVLSIRETVYNCNLQFSPFLNLSISDKTDTVKNLHGKIDVIIFVLQSDGWILLKILEVL